MGEDEWIKDVALKPTGKRLLGKLRHRWEDDSELDVREIGFI
jgi:hypothetical protein